MRSSLEPKIKNFIYTSSIISVVLLIFTGITLLWIQPELPIFYSLPTPSQQLVNKFYLLLFPGISIVISSLHFLIIKTFKYLDKVTLELFAWSTVIIQILITLSLLRIIIITS